VGIPKANDRHEHLKGYINSYARDKVKQVEAIAAESEPLKKRGGDYNPEGINQHTNVQQLAESTDGLSRREGKRGLGYHNNLDLLIVRGTDPDYLTARIARDR
jgi:hypothetical protein